MSLRIGLGDVMMLDGPLDRGGGWRRSVYC